VGVVKAVDVAVIKPGRKRIVEGSTVFHAVGNPVACKIKFVVVATVANLSSFYLCVGLILSDCRKMVYYV